MEFLPKSVVEDTNRSMQEQRDYLNQAIRSMLSNQEESEFPPILRTIDRHLRQYKLQGRVDPYDVFNEAYTRALKKFEAGEEIPLLPAWFRTTSFYIVCEWSRKHQRHDQADSIDDEAYQETLPYHRSGLNHLDLMAMREAYSQLPALDRKVLLMHASGMTWEEVARRLIESGEQSGDLDRTTQSIAQRGHRARKRLRENYSE